MTLSEALRQVSARQDITRLSLVLALACLLAGCATVPYRYAPEEAQAPYGPQVPLKEPHVVHGRRNAFLDGLGHYVVSLPTKIILWSWRIENHRVPPEVEAKLTQYLAENRLADVQVRLNQYSPGAEWKRLVRNRGVWPVWRYTLGGYSVVMYTVFPGRVFGGDHFNPYTNTINLYSGHASIALHEAGHAKDFACRSRAGRGWYAFVRLLPLVPLYQEAVATSDALSYDRHKGLARDEKADYKVLYPAYCTYIAGEGLRFWAPRGPAYVVTFLAAVPGHVVGRIKAAFVPGSDGATAGPQSAADALAAQPDGSTNGRPDR